VRVRRGPATVTGERTRESHRRQDGAKSSARGGKAGGVEIRESGDWSFARKPNRGEDPEGGSLWREIPSNGASL
jgi:hypothetical protein